MGTIVIYKSYMDLLSDFKPKMGRVIDRGREGVTYTDELDAYKLYIYDYPKNEQYRKNPEQLITVDDFELPSFAFPKNLYIINGLLMATRSRYIPNDIFTNWHNEKSIEVLKLIDFDKLIEAYYRMLKDIEELSNNDVEVNDLAGNMLFDGTNIYGVDTCFYEKNTSQKYIHNYNRYALNYAIAYYFSFLIEKHHELDKYFGTGLSFKTDIEKGIKEVEKIVK